MKQLVFVTCILIGGLVKAQLPQASISKELKQKNSLILYDTLPKLKSKKPLLILPNLKQTQKMPTVMLQNNGAYIGKLRQGFNLYRMNLDNMPCLVPDSSYTSKMPLMIK